MANPNLPQEILVEIFTRLPAKSIGKCRCLSKTWQTQLSTKHFTNSHLIHTLKNQDQEEKQVFVISPSSNLKIVAIPLENQEEMISRNVQLPQKKWYIVVGSCNGLVLLVECDKEFECNMFVVNPLTCQQVKIPNPHSSSFSQIYGFGYDDSCDDYKVVTISYDDGTFVDVYSLKDEVWRTVGRFPPNPIPSVHIMPFINGAVHWLTRDETRESKYRLDAFRLCDETFVEVPIPKGFRPVYLINALVVFKGCLGIVDRFVCKIADVWVMKEYGAVDSWEMVRFDVGRIGETMKPVCPVRCEEDVLYVATGDRDCVVVCNMEDEIILWGLGNMRWCFFVESLVSPKQEYVVSS